MADSRAGRWFDWGGLLLAALIEGAARFLNTAVAKALADFEGGGEPYGKELH